MLIFELFKKGTTINQMQEGTAKQDVAAKQAAIEKINEIVDLANSSKTRKDLALAMTSPTRGYEKVTVVPGYTEGIDLKDVKIGAEKDGVRYALEFDPKGNLTVSVNDKMVYKRSETEQIVFYPNQTNKTVIDADGAFTELDKKILGAGTEFHRATIKITNNEIQCTAYNNNGTSETLKVENNEDGRKTVQNFLKERGFTINMETFNQWIQQQFLRMSGGASAPDELQQLYIAGNIIQGNTQKTTADAIEDAKRNVPP